MSTSASPTLDPPLIGELVGLRDSARITGDLAPLQVRVAQLAADGYPHGELGAAIGVKAAIIRAMVRTGLKQGPVA